MTTSERMKQRLCWHPVEEVARRLAVSSDHVRALIRRGDLEAVDISAGRRPTYRIAPESLRAFVEARVLRRTG